MEDAIIEGFKKNICVKLPDKDNYDVKYFMIKFYRSIKNKWQNQNKKYTS